MMLNHMKTIFSKSMGMLSLALWGVGSLKATGMESLEECPVQKTPCAQTQQSPRAGSPLHSGNFEAFYSTQHEQYFVIQRIGHSGFPGWDDFFQQLASASPEESRPEKTSMTLAEIGQFYRDVKKTHPCRFYGAYSSYEDPSSGLGKQKGSLSVKGVDWLGLVISPNEDLFLHGAFALNPAFDGQRSPDQSPDIFVHLCTFVAQSLVRDETLKETPLLLVADNPFVKALNETLPSLRVKTKEEDPALHTHLVRQKASLDALDTNEIQTVWASEDPHYCYLMGGGDPGTQSYLSLLQDLADWAA